MSSKKIFILCLVLLLGIMNPSYARQEKQVTCTGKVIDDQGQPVTGARVRLYEQIHGRIDRVSEMKLGNEYITKTDGHFTLNVAKSDGSVLVRYVVVEKEGLAPGFALLASWIPWEDEELEIKLTEKLELKGTVVDENDRPIPHAVVSVYYLGDGETNDKMYPMSQLVPELSTARTDEGGHFAFANLPAETKVDFLVKKADYAALYTYTGPRDMEYSAGQTDVKLVLIKEARIEGIVVEKDSAKPVPGVTLEIRTERNHSIIGQDPVRTGEDGTFSIEALVAGNYVVQLAQRRDRLSEWVAAPAIVKLETGQVQKDLRIEVCKGGFLEVHITDAQSKEPLEKARVHILGGMNVQQFNGWSDENGVARVRLMPGEYRINSLEKQGYTRKTTGRDPITIEDGKTIRVKRQLTVTPKIAGVVRDEENHPVKGATVNVHPIGSRRDAVTDSEGKYEVSWSSDIAVPPWYGPGRWLLARHEGRNLAAIDEDVTEQTKTCDIKLRPGVMITGKVVDSDGKGIPGANLKVTLQGPKWPTILKTSLSRTDDNGNFEIRAIPSGQRGSIEASAEGYGSALTKFHSDAAKDYHLALMPLTLPMADFSVSGRLTDLQGRPIPDVSIMASDYRGSGQPQRIPSVKTDSQGRFILAGVCEDKLQLRINTVYDGKRLSANAITNGGARGITMIAREGRSAVQNLTVKSYDKIIQDSEKVIAGVALDETGSPVAGVSVGVCFRRRKREDGKFVYSRCSFDEMSCTTDERGRFAIELEEDGEHSLLVLPDHHAAMIVYDIPVGTKDLKVTLSEGGTVSGRLVRMDKDRKVPISNVKVRISQLERDAFMYLGPGSEQTATTDTEGRFCFKHVRTKIRSRRGTSEERWDYVPRVWKISYGNTSKNIAFYEGLKIDDFELVVKPDSTEVKSRVGEALPGFEGIKIDLSEDRTKGKMVLVCFFDVKQRPSRNCIMQLAKQDGQLNQKGVRVIAIQASNVEESELRDWTRQNNIPFPVGKIQGDMEKTRSAWGVQSLPWLILTDQDHIVIAEGIVLSELDDKIVQNVAGK